MTVKFGYYYHELYDSNKDMGVQLMYMYSNIDSALFAIKTNFFNPLYSLDTKSSMFNELKGEIEMNLHHVDSITYSAISI